METENPQNQAPEVRVTFTEDQQKKVNELIQEAQGRAAKELRTELNEYKTQMTTLKQELEEAKTNAANAKTTQQKGEATADVVALEAKISEMNSAHKNILSELEASRQREKQKEAEVRQARENAINIRKEIALTQAANKINPFDVEEVVRATKDSVAWDEDKGKFMVVDPVTQQPRLNSAFDPMTLDEFYLEFASKKPYFIRSGVRPGTGSTEGSSGTVSGKFTPAQIFGKNSNSALAAKLSVQDPKEYARLKTLARQEGIISW